MIWSFGDGEKADVTFFYHSDMSAPASAAFATQQVAVPPLLVPGGLHSQPQPVPRLHTYVVDSLPHEVVPGIGTSLADPHRQLQFPLKKRQPKQAQSTSTSHPSVSPKRRPSQSQSQSYRKIAPAPESRPTVPLPTPVSAPPVTLAERAQQYHHALVASTSILPPPSHPNPSPALQRLPVPASYPQTASAFSEGGARNAVPTAAPQNNQKRRNKKKSLVARAEAITSVVDGPRTQQHAEIVQGKEGGVTVAQEGSDHEFLSLANQIFFELTRFAPAKGRINVAPAALPKPHPVAPTSASAPAPVKPVKAKSWSVSKPSSDAPPHWSTRLPDDLKIVLESARADATIYAEIMSLSVEQGLYVLSNFNVSPSSSLVVCPTSRVTHAD